MRKILLPNLTVAVILLSFLCTAIANEKSMKVNGKNFKCDDLTYLIDNTPIVSKFIDGPSVFKLFPRAKTNVLTPTLTVVIEANRKTKLIPAESSNRFDLKNLSL